MAGNDKTHGDNMTPKTKQFIEDAAAFTIIAALLWLVMSL